jgi:hypothetical protein
VGQWEIIRRLQYEEFGRRRSCDRYRDNPIE